MRDDAATRPLVEACASALYRLLPATGERSFRAVAGRLGHLPLWSDADKGRALRSIIAGTLRDRTFGPFVEAVVLDGIAQCRDEGVPVSADELAKVIRAVEAFGITVPVLHDPFVLSRPPAAPPAEVAALPVRTDDIERRERVLKAHAELYAGTFGDAPGDRLPKVANVVAGLLSAHRAKIVQVPEAKGDAAAGTFQLGGQEYALDLRWSLAAPAAALRAAGLRALGPAARHAVVWVIEGLPGDLRLDPERDRWTVLLDGRDLALLLEGRWKLADALRYKEREQRASAAFAPLPLVPAEAGESPAPAAGAGTARRAPTPPPEAGESPAPAVGAGTARRAPTPMPRAAPAPAQPAKRAEPLSPAANSGVMAANAAEFDRLTVAGQVEERREARRLQFIRVGLVAVLAVAIVTAVIVIRAIQGAQASDLAAAESVVRAAIAAQAQAYRTLDTTGLERYFDESLVAQMQAAIEDLRARGVYVEGERSVQVAEKELRDGAAVFVILQTSELELRSLATSELVDRAPRQQQAIAVLVEKSSAGRWRIVGMQQLE